MISCGRSFVSFCYYLEPVLLVVDDWVDTNKINTLHMISACRRIVRERGAYCKASPRSHHRIFRRRPVSRKARKAGSQGHRLSLPYYKKRSPNEMKYVTKSGRAVYETISFPLIGQYSVRLKSDIIALHVVVGQELAFHMMCIIIMSCRRYARPYVLYRYSMY